MLNFDDVSGLEKVGPDGKTTAALIKYTTKFGMRPDKGGKAIQVFSSNNNNMICVLSLF